MCPTTLRPLLANPAFAPADITPAALLCQQWFKTTASLESFVVSSVFQDLLARNFDDPQGVPSAMWNRFRLDVLPHIIAVLDATDPLPVLHNLVVAYHSSQGI